MCACEKKPKKKLLLSSTSTSHVHIFKYNNTTEKNVFRLVQCQIEESLVQVLLVVLWQFLIVIDVFLITGGNISTRCRGHVCL